MIEREKLDWSFSIPPIGYRFIPETPRPIRESPSLRFVRLLTKAADDRWQTGWKVAGLLALLLAALVWG